MIKELKMSGVSSYKTETSLVTDKKNNLIYGLNGTGKSTLSGYFYNFNTHDNDEKYKNCSGLEAVDKITTEILVYNQQFINDNFYASEVQHGIFSLSKTNKDAQNKIDNANTLISSDEEKITNLETQLNNLKDRYDKKKSEYLESVWETEKAYAGGDSILDPWFKGLKSKEKFFNYVLKIQCPKKQPEISVKEIKKQLGLLNDSKGVQISKKENINFDFESIETNEIFERQIVGNKNSTISKVIGELKNADWVDAGRSYLKSAMEQQCPFCQQNTVTKEFINELDRYFDETYQKDLVLIEDLKTQYEKMSAKIIAIEFDNPILNKFSEKYGKMFSELRNVLNNNMNLINHKKEAPSSSVTLYSTSQFVGELNSIIDEMNTEIEKYNIMIADKSKAVKRLEDQFWENVRLECYKPIEFYLSEKREYDKRKAEISTKKIGLENDIAKQNEIIKSERKKIVNIDDAVENINSGLIDIGITDFTIENHSNGFYKIKRNDDEANIFRTLSEGEKMVVSFLYFVELCKGTKNPDSTVSNKIVVIDDPISSLSHIFVFNIGRLIKDEFLLKESKYEQVFILTHNLYFFYEIADKKHKESEESNQKLFRLQKNNTGTTICEMKYSDIQNDYQAYWSMIKNPKTPPALLANCMRNVLDHFFGFIEKNCLNEIFNKKELRDRKYQAFYRYVNRESHSDSVNIFDMKEYNYDDFKEAFRLIFILSGYEKHYDKMMK
ncbi:AAA family ATPase [bacterium]|nr:AAA family ATPase [bacterium]